MRKRSAPKPQVAVGHILAVFSLIFVVSILSLETLYTHRGTTLGEETSAGSNLSKSKLSAYIFDWTAGGEQIVMAGPKVINVYDPHEKGKETLRDLLRRYKKKYPDGKLIFHGALSPQNARFKIDDDPVESADIFWEDYIFPALSLLSPEDQKLFDYITGSNEFDNTPTLISPREMKWLVSFWSRLADRIHDAGFVPNIGEIPVGNIEVNEPDTYLPPLVPLLKKLKEYGGIWSYHAYSLKHTKDVETEKWWTFRYRFYYEYFQKKYPEVADVPMVLTEAGFDIAGDRITDGWQKFAKPDVYQDWLAWFDSEIQKDPYIIGATVFQIGDTWWVSSDIEPIAPWLSAHISGKPYVSPTPIIRPTNVPDLSDISHDRTVWSGIKQTFRSIGEFIVVFVRSFAL